MENIDEKLKYEVAAELGLFEKIKKKAGRALLQKKREGLAGLLQREKNVAGTKKQKAL